MGISWGSSSPSEIRHSPVQGEQPPSFNTGRRRCPVSNHRQSNKPTLGATDPSAGPHNTGGGEREEEPRTA